MKRQIRGAAFAAAPFLIASTARAQSYGDCTAPRNAVVDAAGARTVEVDAAAGSPESRHARPQAGAGDGDGPVVFATVPPPHQADRRAEAGDFTVDGATGSVRVTDGPGSLTIQNIGGDVKVSDGSGQVEVRNVTGSFTVESDGSGSIHASDIRGSVIVESDGSGGIEVSKIGRDFRVDSNGSGSIDYATALGQVVIPEVHRGRERDRNEASIS